MREHYSPPTRPFRTFQNKAMVSSNCAQRPAPPSCCWHLCQPPTSLTASSKVQLDLWPRWKELLRLMLFCPTPFPLCEDWIIYEWKWFCGTEDVCEATAAVHVVVLCLLRGLTVLPPSQPQQLCYWRSSVSQCDFLKFCIDLIVIQGQNANYIVVFKCMERLRYLR